MARVIQAFVIASLFVAIGYSCWAWKAENWEEANFRLLFSIASLLFAIALLLIAISAHLNPFEWLT